MENGNTIQAPRVQKNPATAKDSALNSPNIVPSCLGVTEQLRLNTQ
jgi:hypothetical protein